MCCFIGFDRVDNEGIRYNRLELSTQSVYRDPKNRLSGVYTSRVFLWFLPCDGTRGAITGCIVSSGFLFYKEGVAWEKVNFHWASTFTR
jgi:hypothetical protein